MGVRYHTITILQNYRQILFYQGRKARQKPLWKGASLKWVGYKHRKITQHNLYYSKRISVWLCHRMQWSSNIKALLKIDANINLIMYRSLPNKERLPICLVIQLRVKVTVKWLLPFGHSLGLTTKSVHSFIFQNATIILIVTTPNKKTQHNEEPCNLFVGEWDKQTNKL